jgi:hypothetical protein
MAQGSLRALWMSRSSVHLSRLDVLPTGAHERR